MKSNSDDNEPPKTKRNMGKRCAAFGCSKTVLDGVGMFQFPNPERSPARFNYWRDVVEYTRADFKYDKNSSYLCSDHFEEDQIENYYKIQIQHQADPAAKVRWKLLKGACPSVVLLPPLPNINMGKRCAAFGCSKTELDGVGIFRFPNPERSPTQFKYWHDVVERNRADFEYDKNNSYLCSDHFEKDQIENYYKIHFQRQADPAAKVRWKLAKGACPSVVLLPSITRRNMGKRCAAFGCSKTVLDGVGIFQFPNPERSPTRFNYWRDVVEYTRADFKFNKNSSFLCSDHFEEDQIENYFKIQFQRQLDPAAKVRWKLAKGACPSIVLLPALSKPATLTTFTKKKPQLKKSDTAPFCLASTASNCRARAKQKSTSKRARMMSVQDVIAIEDTKDCKAQRGDTAMRQLHIEEESISLEDQSHCEKTAFVYCQKEPTAMDDNYVPACMLKEILIQEEDHDKIEIKEESLEDETYSDASIDPLSTCEKNLFEVYHEEDSVIDDRQTNAGLYKGTFLNKDNIDLSQNCMEIKKENHEDNGNEQTDAGIPEGGYSKEEDSDLSQDCLEIKEESLEYDTISDSQSARFSVEESLDENSANNKMRKKLCRVCNKRISFYYLKAHMRVHTKERPYVCEICNMTFTVRSSLVRHMQKHTEGIIFPCDICKKVFPKREILKQHKEVHKNEKRYSCDVCKKFFTTKTTLRHHLEIHLEKKTITWETLLNHMRIYQTEKPYICDICNEEFSLKSGLTRHKRIHKTDGTFTCGICNKSLSQKRTLAVHMKTHTKTF